jgi:di/tricarboxylate transporter
MFFLLTAALSSAGPGNIAATALMAPLGMAAAGRYRISPFLMAIMIANGASAGSVSPVAPTGVIVNQLVAKMGLPDARWTIYGNNFMAHAAVAGLGFLLLGGAQLFRRRTATVATLAPHPVALGQATAAGVDLQPEHEAVPARYGRLAAVTPPPDTLTRSQWLTLVVITAMIVSAVVFNVNVGMAAFTGALLLTLAGAANEAAAFKAVPWSVIVMVTGVTVLVALLEKTGGMDLFTEFIGHLATPATVTALTGFFTGLVSIYSSTTGVVLPAMLPIIPGVIQHMGGGDPMALVSSMVVGGHLVDVSPLSTLGALCLAAAPPGTDTRRLFNQLLAWGVSMTLVAALVCWIFFGLIE